MCDVVVKKSSRSLSHLLMSFLFCVCVCVCVHAQYLARLRMDLDVANRRLETADEEKRKLIQERDEVGN